MVVVTPNTIAGIGFNSSGLQVEGWRVQHPQRSLQSAHCLAQPHRGDLHSPLQQL